MQEIEALFTAYSDAVFRKDVAAYTALYDDDVLIFDMWEDWQTSGLSTWQAMAQDWFGSLGLERVVVTVNNINIQAAENFATATAIVKFAAIDENDQELRYLENRLTWVIVKKANDWKIVHQHTSVPISFEGLKGILKK